MISVIWSYRFKFWVASLTVCLLAPFAWGEANPEGSVYWEGSTSNDWSTVSNWKYSAQPTLNSSGAIKQDVVIGGLNASEYTVVYNGDFSIDGKLTVGRSNKTSETTVQNNEGTTTKTVNYLSDYGKADLTIQGNARLGSLQIGQSTSGSLTVVPTAGDAYSSVTIGSGKTSDYIWAGYAYDNGVVAQTTPTASVLDLSAVHTVNINVNRFAIAGRNDNCGLNASTLLVNTTNGINGYKMTEGATVKLGTNNTVTTKKLDMATSFGANLGAVQTTLEFGEGTNVLNVDQAIIGGMKAEAVNVSVDGVSQKVAHTASIREGGTFTMAGVPIANGDGTTTTTKANLWIAENTFVNTGNVSKATLDLSNARMVSMDLDVLAIGRRSALCGLIAVNQAGYRASNKQGGTDGTLKLGNHAMVTANSIELATMDVYYKKYSTDGKGVKATIEMGGDSVLSTPSLVSGNNTVKKWQYYNDYGDLSDPANNYYKMAPVDGSQTTSTFVFNDGGTLDVAETMTGYGHTNVQFNNGGWIHAQTLNIDGHFSAEGTGKTHGNITVDGTTTFSGESFGSSVVDISGTTLSTGHFQANAGSTAGSAAFINITDNGTLNADSFATSGPVTITVGTYGDLSDNSALNVAQGISHNGPVTFVLNSGCVTTNLIDVIVMDGQTNPVFQFLGGKLVVEQFLITNHSTGTETAVSGGTLVSEEGLFSTLNVETLHQSGNDTILSPGDDGNYGKTQIMGNYILESGTIHLDINSEENRDVLNVNGTVMLGNTNTELAVNTLMTDATDTELLTNAVTTNSLDMFSMSTMAVEEEETDLEMVDTPVNSTPSSPKDVLLFSADEILFADGSSANEWGQSHVTGLSNAYSYAVVPTSSLLGDSSAPLYSLVATNNETMDATEVPAVPEPGTWMLFLLGVLSLYRRRRV